MVEPTLRIESLGQGFLLLLVGTKFTKRPQRIVEVLWIRILEEEKQDLKEHMATGLLICRALFRRLEHMVKLELQRCQKADELDEMFLLVEINHALLCVKLAINLADFGSEHAIIGTRLLLLETLGL